MHKMAVRLVSYQCPLINLQTYSCIFVRYIIHNKLKNGWMVFDTAGVLGWVVRV
jgi:hypothetical protein